MHAPSSSRPPSRTGKATFKENALSDAECELLERHFPNEYSCGMQTVRAMLRALGRSECVGRAWRDDDDFKRVSSYQGRRQQKAKAAGAIIADGRKTRSKGDEAEVALATLSATGNANAKEKKSIDDRSRAGETLASPSSPCAPLTDGARPLELPPALTHR